MAYLNRHEIMGNVGKNLRISKRKRDNEDIVSFSVATSRRYKNQNGETMEDVQWHNVTAFPPISKYVIACHTKTGASVYCAGPVIHEVSTDETTGQKHYNSYIKLEEFQMLSARAKQTTCPTCGTQFTPGSDNSATVTNGNQAQAPTNDELDDLPF